jgi:hypothetical protein
MATVGGDGLWFLSTCWSEPGVGRSRVCVCRYTHGQKSVQHKGETEFTDRRRLGSSKVTVFPVSFRACAAPCRRAELSENTCTVLNVGAS